jgi:putative sigma-54 modulation protein
MRFELTFRNLETSDAIKAYAQDKLAKLDKYLRPPAEAHVAFSMERRLHCVDVSVHEAGVHYQGRAEEQDMYASIDAVVDKLLRQLHRNRDQNHNHRRGPQADDSPRE